MRRVFLLLCVLGAAPTAFAADPFRAVNWLTVVPINANTFEVLESRGAGVHGIWCAAADYARAAGLDGVRKRMYVLDTRGPARTRANETGVVFTTNPDEQLAKTPTSYSVSVTTKGANLSIAQAYIFCETLFEETLDRF
jgi:hypothetical protein